MDNSIQIANINKYCSKCLSLLGNDVVLDGLGRKFCSVDCRRDFYAEIRKEINCRYEEWIMKE